MKHSFLDQYSGGDSLIHRLDPRTKFIVCLAFIITAVMTPESSWLSYAILFVFIIILLIVSRVPLLHVLRRSLVIFPFVLFIAIFIPFFTQGEIAVSYKIWLWQVSVTYNGLFILVNVLIRSFLSILSLVLLTSTTKFNDLLSGLKKLGVPGLMISILAFMYRYLFVLIDEVMRMSQARDSRNFGNNGLRQIRTAGNMIGTLFIRSYERGERVYAAMLARGFDGEVRTIHNLHFTRVDVFSCVFSCMALAFSIIVRDLVIVHA